MLTAGRDKLSGQGRMRDAFHISERGDIYKSVVFFLGSYVLVLS